MARRCKCKCGAELKPAARCDDIIEKRGYASTKCLILHTRAKNAEKAEAEQKQKIKSLKKKVRDEDRSYWLKKAQQSFNAYIRHRDADLPCISCDSNPNDKNLMTGSRWDCGHYRSVGANPELRFEELNTAKQCVKCNRDLSGNVVNYRIGLIKRIGIEKVEWIEGPHSPKKYTIDELKAIDKKYRELVKTPV